MNWIPVIVLIAFATPSEETESESIAWRICNTELEAFRFVATPEGGIYPLFWDLDLAAYLTQSMRALPPGTLNAHSVVLPVYAERSFIFRTSVWVFVSTGLLANVSTQNQLAEQLMRAAMVYGRRKTNVRLHFSACGELLTQRRVQPDQALESLRTSIRTYEEYAARRLKLR